MGAGEARVDVGWRKSLRLVTNRLVPGEGLELGPNG